MKSDYRVRAYKFIMNILPYIKDCLYNEREVEDRIWQFNASCNRNLKFAAGSARIALITSDYVIKWDYDLKNVEDIGGCDEETRAYKEAVNAGFGYLCAECTQVVVNNIHFNIMPRINNIGRKAHHGKEIDEFLTAEEYEWIREFNKDIHSYNWGIKNNKAVMIDYGFTQEVVDRFKRESA